MLVCALVATPVAVAGTSNDDFANATTIERIDDASFTDEIHDDNVGATTESGEPQHRDATKTEQSGGTSVWYSFTPAYTGPAEFMACTNIDPSVIPGFVSFDGLAGVYTGGSVGDLTSDGTNGPTDCDGIAGTSDIKNDFQAQSGTNYHFAVAGAGDAQGNIIARVFQRPQNDDFANAETISGAQGQATGDNIFATEEAGEPSHRVVGPAAGSIWYRWTAPMDGRVKFDTCGSEGFTSVGVYTGSSVDSLNRVSPSVHGVGCDSQGFDSVVATTGTTYWIGVDSRASSPGGITLEYNEVKIPETTITAGPTGLINDATPTFKFESSPPGTGFQCRIDSQPFGPCAGPHGTYTPEVPLGDGPHTFMVRAYTRYAFDRSPATRNVTVDTTRPRTAITRGPTGVTHDRTPTFEFSSNEAGVRFQCLLRQVGEKGSFGACSGPGASHTPSPPLRNGDYVFSVRARDRAGNLDRSRASRSFTVR
jgi:hypothetical protein